MKDLPELPLDQWEASKNTLHLFLQIAGKIRMNLHPKTNHWWHVPLYVSCRGLTTRPIPFADKLFDISFDFIDHQISVYCSDGSTVSLPLQNQSVASVYRWLIDSLQSIGVEANIVAKPYDVPFSVIPFAQDNEHASYDTQWIEKFWEILRFVNTTFEIFRGRFVGKSTPVHLFWHHMDLALTRFSGKEGPGMQGGTNADKEAYSHEVISFGYWVGDDTIREPAFYAYVYPEPKNMAAEPLQPQQASWRTDYGYAQAFLPYEAVRTAAQPQQTLLTFLESAYEVCARRAGWDVEDFKLNS